MKEEVRQCRYLESEILSNGMKHVIAHDHKEGGPRSEIRLLFLVAICNLHFEIMLKSCSIHRTTKRLIERKHPNCLGSWI